MNLNHPIHIDLLEFFKTGKFDCLKLGQTKDWIIKNFPDPDEVYRNSYASPIWFYGNVELHFHDDETLFLIYSDYIETLDGGPSLHLNKWILSEPEKLTLEYVIHYLNLERVNFNVVHKTLSQGFVSASIEIISSNVLLGFLPTENEEEDFEEYLVRCKTEDSNKFMLTLFNLTTR